MNNHDKLIKQIFFTDQFKINNSNNIKYKKNKNTKYNNICKYLSTRYCDSKSEKETLYRILYGIEIRPVCKICGNEVKFNGRNGVMFLSHCSNKCKKLDKDVNYKWKMSCGSKGTNRIKAKATMIERYGHENPYQIPSVIAYIKNVNEQKRNESIAKRKQTCLSRYGVDSYMKTNEFQKRRIETSLKKYGTTFPIQSDIVKQKYDWKSICEKINNKKIENKSFNTSNDEDIAYDFIKTKYEDVQRQYKCDKYPYLCDFYIPSIDAYIECQFGWQHGNHPFDNNDINDINELNRMASKKSKYYDNVIYNWSIRDVEKRKTAQCNGLNYIEFWSLNDLLTWLSLPLYIHYDWKRIKKEFRYYQEKEGNLNGSTSFNYIIKYYQQNTFYKKENELISNSLIREKIIANRCKYLNKSRMELTTDDLLLGFKRSGLYVGYSHFNPLILKYFIKKYDVKKCYDPCGGWGHRLLGACNLEKYIYNDLSQSTYNNIKRIIHDLKIKNVVAYNNDARNFIPNENFDAMFTCPPYYNLESYECGDFESYEEYEKFIESLFDVFYSKESCKIFGIVIREDYLNEKFKNKCIESFTINNKNSKHLTSTANHINKEKLYIFIK